MSTTPTCAQCRRVTRQHFQITRFDAAGTQRGQVAVCSALCLMRWAYAFGVDTGVRAATTLRDAVTSLIEGFKG